ncbi:MAG: ABC transporter ATP-binding protein [Candidatus Helarchaeota archaeon]|nr:ABC transporter ATP-binding protein [Candidatus Helarchaeota archaeon]
MSDIAIRVENLSKLYKIGRKLENYRTLRESLANTLSARLRWGKNPKSQTRNPNSDYIWALKDVSLEIKRGEVVGIVGRNGAGKSTLLKILSRITEPTEGYAEIHGRVGSLLEVGTGFHPELTGRENIFLNGAILGMKKAEIERNFDEIVAFAEVDKFIDTPVKHYSSGMYVRLAFAVAAHLEPEILVVDEVLAVGDLQFQKKCLGKIGDVAKGGRTVLLVSHQMNQIHRLSEKGIWLDNGQIQRIGPAGEVITAYEAKMSSISIVNDREKVEGHMKARFYKWEITEPRHEHPNILQTMGPLKLRFILKVHSPIHNAQHGIALYNNDGQLMWGTDASRIILEKGLYELIYRLPTLPLRPGIYSWRVSLCDDKGLLDDWDCTPGLIVGTKPVTHSKDEWSGILNIPCEFMIKALGE